MMGLEGMKVEGQVLSDVTLEGMESEDWGVTEGENATVWREGVEVSESKAARMIWRVKVEKCGSQRTASMYVSCGNLWICTGSAKPEAQD